MKLRTRLKKQHWWAYLDTDGVVHVREYISDWEIEKCEQMPFCYGIFPPFEARTKRDAKLKIAAFLKEQQMHEKKVSK